MSKRRAVTKDFYRILQVSKTATTEEIKTSYRKLALTLHPDRNDGDAEKTVAFKEASEAYDILINPERRRQYDVAHGYATPSGWYNKNRKRPPPANYRKVYAPHAPPNGKWHDAHRHYNMHYGDGMFQEALKGAYDRARLAGELEYHSPLGKGFSFDSIAGASSSSSSTASAAEPSYNPFSKAAQGPPTQEYRYEEGYVDEHQTILKRRRGVVSKLHERRQERYSREDDERSEEQSTIIVPGQKTYQPLNQQRHGSGDGGDDKDDGGGGCIVM